MNEHRVRRPGAVHRTQAAPASLLAIATSALLIGCSGQVTFDVNTEADLRDANPGDGVCEVAGAPGVCSLRAAAEEVDAGDFDTYYIVNVPFGTYTLTQLPGLPSPQEGLTMTDANVRFEGAGSFGTFLDGGHETRLFTLENGSLHVAGLTLRDGHAAAIAGGQGGAIYAADASVLVERVRILNSEAELVGGAIAARGSSAAHRLGVTNTVLDGNIAAVGAAGGGGGVFSDIPTELVNVQVEGNMGGHGGGVWLAGTGSHSISRSAFVVNEAHSGGAISLVGGGSLSIDTTTISNNVSCWRAAAIRVGDGDAEIRSSTIVENSIGAAADDSVFCDPLAGETAGIMSTGDPIALLNTVVADNVSRTTPADCDATINSGGWNFIGTDAGCTVVAAASDQVGSEGQELDPGLAGLSDFPGPTSTHQPLLSSPLLDAGGLCGALDQHEDPRPTDGDGDGVATCDIGAIEY